MRLEGVPDGYEVVRWGQPSDDECWMDGHQVACGPSDRLVLIIRKVEPILDLSKVRLKKGWIAQDKSGANYWYSHKPVIDGPQIGWIHEASEGRQESYLSTKGLHISWRADVPWTERIMEIPE